MRSRTGRLLFRAWGAIFIVSVSFWLTLLLMDTLDIMVDPATKIITVAAATYGLNCRNSVNGIREGNATGPIAQKCSSKTGVCSFVVHVEELGDPAPGCGKDLRVEWRCGQSTEVHTAFVPAEADKQPVTVYCPARS